jgi:superfamily I DNA/RNA helicase
VFGRVTALMVGNKSPFDFVVVDEAQDVGVAELRFLASLGANRADGLFFGGDLGQRIFQQPFFLALARRRCPWPFLDVADQLPNLTPDPSPG